MFFAKNDDKGPGPIAHGHKDDGRPQEPRARVQCAKVYEPGQGPAQVFDRHEAARRRPRRTPQDRRPTSPTPAEDTAAASDGRGSRESPRSGFFFFLIFVLPARLSGPGRTNLRSVWWPRRIACIQRENNKRINNSRPLILFRNRNIVGNKNVLNNRHSRMMHVTLARRHKVFSAACPKRIYGVFILYFSSRRVNLNSKYNKPRQDKLHLISRINIFLKKNTVVNRPRCRYCVLLTMKLLKNVRRNASPCSDISRPGANIFQTPLYLNNIKKKKPRSEKNSVKMTHPIVYAGLVYCYDIRQGK